MGIIRFGKFGSTYNDNGAAERSFRIDRLVNALQTYGMSYQDSADLYRTQNGQYVVEDIQGEVVAEVPNLKEWRKENRRMFAQVKNAKAKPVERFFHTLEVLLSDLVLPGYVRDITASAPEDEEATRRLTWQKEQGYILSYDEFIGKVKDAIIRYENRNHAGLKRSPLEELRYAQEKEGWAPSWLDSDDIRHLFLERDNRIVKGNRVRIEGFYYLGPELTQDMVRENRHNLAGLSGLKVEVFYDPDDPAAGAWAVDPRSGETIYLTPEERIDPFNSEEVSQQLKSKRSSMRAVSSSFRETTAAAGKVLTSPEYKPRIEAQSVANKAIEAKTEKAALVSSMSNEEFTAAVAVSNRIAKEQQELVKRKAVYPTPMKRYQAILDIILRGENLSSGDRLFKAEYESRMGPEEKTKWNIYINFNQGVKHGLK
jgi:putative transposase